MVERRINYASSVGLEHAFKHSYDAHDDMLNILSTYHDLSAAAVSFSGDIAKVIYPFMCIKAVNAEARLLFWRQYVSLVDVPLPLLHFLNVKFCDTNWDYVFLRGDINPTTAGDTATDFRVKDIYHSRTIAISRILRETEPDVPSGASSSGMEIPTAPPGASSSTMEVQRTPRTDEEIETAEITTNVALSCHYSSGFHDGDLILPSFAVHMKSKNANRRWRYVCVDCCHWMDSNGWLDDIREL